MVVCGSNDINVQVIVNAINNAIGAYGKTIDFSKPVNYRQGIDKDLADLVADMDSGKVGALLIYGANPAYTYYDADKFKAALAKVKQLFLLAKKWMKPQSRVIIFFLPITTSKAGVMQKQKQDRLVSMQPTIYPLFKTRPFQTSLLKWSGNDTDYDTYFKNYWTGKLGSDEAFEKALQDGVLEPTSSGSCDRFI